ncbi:MAG: branched-chain-amino-acid transaminase [Planctomycetota bacterium]
MAADEQVWIDGKLVNKGDAMVSVFDHGLLYGDGVFEGIRAYGGKVFEEQAHLDRFYESARSIRLDVPYSADELSKVMSDLLVTNGLTDAYIRLVATRGVGDLGLDPRKCPRASVFCIASTITLYPEELYEKGLEVVVASHCKNHPNATPPRVKSLNYLNSVLGKIEANDAGVLEAIMLNHLGHVAECTADNVFLVKNDVVSTPPAEAGILEGITRDVVMRLCQQEGIECRERNLVRHDLYVADECFLTGTAAEVIPVVKIDGRPIGPGTPGKVSRRLKQAFHAYARGERDLPR